MKRCVLVLAGLSACDLGATKSAPSASASSPVTDVRISSPTLDFPLPAFELIDHEKQPFTRDGMVGSVWVAGFIFTSCPTVCPGLTRKMSALAKELGAAQDVRFLTITIDPENDTPEKLAAFAARHGEPTPRWRLVTGPSKVVDETVLKGFMLPFSRGATPAEVTHSERFVVVDKRAHLRGVYDTDAPGLGALKEKVEALRAE